MEEALAKPSRRTVRRASQPERTVIRTSGEIFADGSVIELVSLANDDQLGVLFWHNNRKTIAAQVDLLETLAR